MPPFKAFPDSITMEELRWDNACLQMKGQAPSEKVCRDLLLDLPEKTASELRLLNKQMLSLKAQSEGCLSVILNVEDTVCTVYGDQEGTGVGYNPKKNGLEEGLIEMQELYMFSPYIREVRIWTISPLFGEWQDFDNVFTYIHSGEADFYFNGQRYSLQTGDAIMMHPFQTHIVKSNVIKPFVQYIFHFDIEYNGNNLPRDEVLKRGVGACYDINNMPEIEMFFKNKPFIVRLNTSDRQIVEERFLIMLNEYRHKRAGYELVLKSVALELLAVFIRNSNMTQSENVVASKSLKKIEMSVSYIHENYINPNLDNAMVASFCETTQNYLASIFKKHLVLSVHQYINYIRIENAKRTMRYESLNFSEIAEKVGYKSIHVFSKVFKRVTGKSPTEYLAQNLVELDNVR